MSEQILVELAICPSCKGRGFHKYYIPAERNIPTSPEEVLIGCSTCEGRGYIDDYMEDD